MMEIPIESVRYVKELYPRLREDDAAIERYRTALENLPPIVTARGGILVDGFHRWQAHRRENRTTIQAEDLGNLSDAEILREAITRNASHGQQLSAADKKALAAQLWIKFTHLDIPERQQELMSLLSVQKSAVAEWTKEARQAEKAQKQARAWDCWLDCRDYRDIAAEIGVDHTTIRDWVLDFSGNGDFQQPPTSRQHFDVWSFGKAEEEAGTGSYFGRMPAQIVENLLWLYTEPGNIVVDPFAGGGTTIDVAKRMGRRVWASDRKPSTPTLPIHAHDITTSWPEAAPKKADFILLDPPYWKQAEGRYSQDSADLGNMPLEAFMDAWEKTVAHCAAHLSPGGKLAFIISPSVDGERVVDHAFEMYAAAKAAGLISERRIIATYQTQQATGQQVTWAREKRQLLKLYRDLVVMKLP